MPYEKIIPDSERNAVIHPAIDQIKIVFAKRAIDYRSFISNTYLYFKVIPAYFQGYLIEKMIELLGTEFKDRMPNYQLDKILIEKKLRQLMRLYNSDEFPIVYDDTHVNRVNVGARLKEVAFEDMQDITATASPAINDLPENRNTGNKYDKLKSEKISARPIFKTEILQTIFNILKDFFSVEQRAQLKEILKSGDSAEKELIFLDNGNRLADAFKQLYQASMINGCEKKELEKWIIRNFKYRHLQKAKAYTPDYIEKCISRNYYPCKNPLFEIKNGIIEQIDSDRKNHKHL